MFATITVRTKILTLLAVAVLALLVVVVISFQGLKKEGEMLREIGWYACRRCRH
jgi:CHASE3 domain sensor protein